MSQTLVEGTEVQGLVASMDSLCSPSQSTSLYQECLALRSQVTELRSALEQEQSQRQNLERELAAEQEHAALYYRERQDYKQRLREAAIAYGQIKEAYHRLKAAAPTNRAILGVTSVAETPCDWDNGLPTQTVPIAQRSRGPPLLSQTTPSWQQPSGGTAAGTAILRREPQAAAAPSAQLTSGPEPSFDCQKTTKPTQGPLSMPYDDEVVLEEPPQTAVPHKARWKKAVRRSVDDKELEDGTAATTVHRQNKRQQKKNQREDDEEEDGVFMKPPSKKWVSDRPYQPPPPQQAVPGPGPFSGGAGKGKGSTIPPRDETKATTTLANDDNNAPKAFKHQGVVRQREERAQLQGFECEDCKRFYDALERWGAVAVGGLPQCQHHAGTGQGPAGVQQGQQYVSVEQMRIDLRADASRHRYLHEPPLTPNGFWDLGFSPKERPSQD